MDGWDGELQLYSLAPASRLAHSSHTYEKSLQTSGGKDTWQVDKSKLKIYPCLNFFSLDMQSQLTEFKLISYISQKCSKSAHSLTWMDEDGKKEKKIMDTLLGSIDCTNECTNINQFREFLLV